MNSVTIMGKTYAALSGVHQGIRAMIWNERTIQLCGVPSNEPVAHGCIFYAYIFGNDVNAQGFDSFRRASHHVLSVASISDNNGISNSEPFVYSAVS